MGDDGVSVRKTAAYPGNRTSESLDSGETFEFTDTNLVKHEHSGVERIITFYKLADGRGWVHDFHTDEPGTRQIKIPVSTQPSFSRLLAPLFFSNISRSFTCYASLSSSLCPAFSVPPSYLTSLPPQGPTSGFAKSISRSVIALRDSAAYPGDRTGMSVAPNEKFEFTAMQEVPYKHSTIRSTITFYELADGRGWVHDFDPKKPDTRQIKILVSPLYLPLSFYFFYQTLFAPPPPP